MRFSFLAAMALPALLIVSPVATSASAPMPSNWHVYSLAPSGQTLASPEATGQAGDLATFNFPTDPSTVSYLATTQGSQSRNGLLGDIYGKTVTATFTVTGTNAAFWYSTADGNVCGTPSSVRLFFQSNLTDHGAYVDTNYWWSNPVSYQLAADGNTVTLTAPVNGADWSDLNGQFGTQYQAGFEQAASDVTMIGLSFGGGCFFANGVGVQSGSATFHLDSYTVTGTP